MVLMGERLEGTAHMISGLLVAYEAHKGLIADRSLYVDTDEPVDKANSKKHGGNPLLHYPFYSFGPGIELATSNNGGGRSTTELSR